MTWKLLGGMLVLLSTTAIGGCLARQMREQERWMKEIKKVLMLLNGELTYNKTPLPEAFTLVGTRHGGQMQRFLLAIGDALRKQNGSGFLDCWKRESEHWLSNAPLNKEQKREFIDLGECFLGADAVARDNNIAFYLSRVDNELEQLSKTVKDKAYLYRMLGVLGGMFLWILIL